MRMEKPALYRYADQVMRSFEINNEYQAPFSDTKHTVDVQDLNLNTINICGLKAAVFLHEWK
ncbi:MAG TPA: hypothetical protein VJH04_01795 [archaeon]|nr:hypothetical protein [archaeon]